MNFTRDTLGAMAPDAEALVTIGADGERRAWTAGELAELAARAAGTLEARGVRRGDVVMTLIGNRVEWVLTLLACWRIGAIALPCTEQLRAKDLRLRLRVAAPALVVADRRDASELAAAAPACDVLLVGEDDLTASAAAPAAELEEGDGAVIIFTSGTSGEPKAVLHGQRYLTGQRLQAEHWYAPRPGDLAWCTAAAGWSKSARNSFIAPWLRGARALMHDARFDAHQRLDLIEREGVNALCMAPTEYRVLARRAPLRPLPSLRSAVAAGEALDAGVIDAWLQDAAVHVRDGFGQTETGALTGIRPDEPPRPGSMGRPLPGVRTRIHEGELQVDGTTVPTFFSRYLGAAPHEGWWATGDLVDADDDGYLWYRGRADDVIVSAGYRIGPGEVETALASHPAVQESAVVAHADADRGAVVRAIVVLRDGFAPAEALTRDLQDHVKRETAPYKYPRVVDYAEALPRTASGKLRRAALRRP